MSAGNFSWVIQGKLCGSALPECNKGRDDVSWLAGQGVSTIVSLMKPSGAVQKKCSELKLTWLYHPITDFGAPSSINDFSLMIDEIIETMNREKGVCVHCHAGIGRTGLVLACVIGKYLSLPFQKALSTVRRARPAVETPEQEEFIKQFLSEYNV